MSKPADYLIPRVNSNGSYGPWVTMQHRGFINCDCCSVWWEVPTAGGSACQQQGQGDTGNLSTFLLLNFAVNKTALNN